MSFFGLLCRQRIAELTTVVCHLSEAEAAEEKVASIMNFADTEAEKKSENALDYSQIFGLSATTPTFYPRHTADSNDLIQMVSDCIYSN